MFAPLSQALKVLLTPIIIRQCIIQTDHMPASTKLSSTSKSGLIGIYRLLVSTLLEAIHQRCLEPVHRVQGVPAQAVQVQA